MTTTTKRYCPSDKSAYDLSKRGPIPKQKIVPKRNTTSAYEPAGLKVVWVNP